jgi:hypothetical protein
MRMHLACIGARDKSAAGLGTSFAGARDSMQMMLRRRRFCRVLHRGMVPGVKYGRWD